MKGSALYCENSIHHCTCVRNVEVRKRFSLDFFFFFLPDGVIPEEPRSQQEGGQRRHGEKEGKC